MAMHKAEKWSASHCGIFVQKKSVNLEQSSFDSLFVSTAKRGLWRILTVIVYSQQISLTIIKDKKDKIRNFSLPFEIRKQI